MKQFLSLLLAGIIGSVGTVFISNHIESRKNTEPTEYSKSLVNTSADTLVHTPLQPAKEMTPRKIQRVDLKTAAKQSVNAVVHIKKYEENSYSLADFFFGIPQPQQREQIYGYGSGVIISPDGYIVTNHHVIEDNSHIEVVLNNGKSYIAKLVGTDAATDVALLKINAQHLPYLKYGNSDAIEVGDWVLAVGNPFNLTSTVTAGIISAKARSLDIQNRSVDAFIQTDAAVNPGNSGGALVDINGRLIGINDLIYSRTGSYSGYSFAIPSNVVKKVVRDLKEYGTVQRGFLGVSTINLNSREAQQLGLTGTQGAGVVYVRKDFPAYKAGIKAGDIIVKINGIPIKDKGMMQEQIAQYRPGEKLHISVLRKHKELSFDVILANQDGGETLMKTERIRVLGAVLQPISQQEKLRYRLNNGVKIVSIVDGKLKENGVKQGFIIVAVNRQLVKSVDDIRHLIKTTKIGGILLEGIYPDGSQGYYAIRL